MKNFKEFISRYLELMEGGAEISLGNYQRPKWKPTDIGKPLVLLISAHPDDEILTGMPLGIRFKEIGSRVVNLAVTLGATNQQRRRNLELNRACGHLGVELIIPLGRYGPGIELRNNRRGLRSAATKEIAAILRSLRPNVIITHHGDDAHHDHIVTNSITKRAMQQVEGFDCLLIEGQYWKDMANPNLQVEIASDHLALLLEALSFHKGELKRNRYDKFWLPYLNTNARYGELITGWGTPSANFDFSAMYRVTRFCNQKFEDYLHPMQLEDRPSLKGIFPSDWPKV